MGRKVTLTVGPGMELVVKFCADTCEPRMCIEEACKPAETPPAEKGPGGGAEGTEQGASAT